MDLPDILNPVQWNLSFSRRSLHTWQPCAKAATKRPWFEIIPAARARGWKEMTNLRMNVFIRSKME